ncbi:tetratricopeptide repeat protein [Idiomarina sp. Sol25]|uniref:tetratricopeptide repeat protein n=1 Tax=Idiomarina sp. Sol25 TaxID=3064000 RepID=UPI00294B0C9C|nr:tetratricopeptide repeat protein [Idiomarina sp. Sol25]MDV6327871.1 tetratricopeptide repeat protein [Idiomarina sp. Sol25]
MSVINKVLKDLDRRGQQPFSKRAAISAVERRSSHRLALWLLAVMLVIVLALVVFWWQSRSENTMTVTESGPAEMPKLQERVEPFIDTAVIEVPAERTPRSETDSQQSNEIEVRDLEPVTVTETEQEIAEKAEPLPEEPILAAEETESETQKNGEFSKQAVQLSPAEISAQHIEKAQKAQQQGRLTSAEDHWRKALAVTPENKEVRKKLAALQFGRNKVSQALTTLEAGFKLNPDDFEFRLLSARILEKEARPAAALSLLKQATPDAGAYPEYVQKQALLAQSQGDYKAAADAYQRLIESEPAQGRWYLGKAVAQQEFAPEAAVASYKAALKRIKHQPTLDFIEQQIVTLKATESTGEQ